MLLLTVDLGLGLGDVGSAGVRGAVARGGARRGPRSGAWAWLRVLRLGIMLASVAATGGLIEHGEALRGLPLERCNARAAMPPGFSSMRSLRAATGPQLLRRAMPLDLFGGMPARTKPPGAARRPKGADLPPPTTGGEEECDRATIRPSGRISISMLYGSGVYDGEIRPKLQEMAVAAREIEAGRKPAPVATLRVTAARQPVWARGRVWDTSDPDDCHEVVRSTRHTTFPGQRQVNRAEFRAMAAEMAWDRVDPDIVGQLGEGGMEVRSDCAPDTVIAFHQKGFVAEYEAARRVIDANMDEEWVSEPVMHLPFVPCRVNPRNVIMQDRTRVLADGVTVEHYQKPRVTSNTSYGGAESPNGGVSVADSQVSLPSVQTFGLGLAIVGAMADVGVDIPGYDGSADEARGGMQPHGPEYEGVAGYTVDAESAYSFCPVQRADQHLQCFFWWRGRQRADGSRDFRPGVSVSSRLEFGGAFAPNRFCRTSAVVAAHAGAAQARFDARQPPPPRVVAASAFRAGLQAAGELSDGAGQSAARCLQIFVDDGNGGTTKDKVVSPDEVSHIHISAVTTTAMGGVVAPMDSRVMVHTKLFILSLRRMGMADAEQKTVVGDPLGSLGFEVRIRGCRIRCTEAKRVVMLDDIERQLGWVTADRLVRCKPAERLVGRFTNLSQIYPELRARLHAGYRVAMGRWQSSSTGATTVQAELKLAQGSGAQRGWIHLLEVGGKAVDANVGVPLASQPEFYGRLEAGVYTSTVDASGVDGVGGFATIAGAPGHVWVMSERWPTAIQRALDAASTTGSERAKLHAAQVPMLGMPGAELFGNVAIVDSIQHATGASGAIVYAIGDCEPAAAALNSGAGRTPQMRALTDWASEVGAAWLGVAVPREENTDADLLSHPDKAMVVIRRAADSGLRVHEARISAEALVVLSKAAALGVKGGYELPQPVAGDKRGCSEAGVGAQRADEGEMVHEALIPLVPRVAHGVGVGLDLWHSDPWRASDGTSRRPASVAVVVFSGEDERLAGLPAQLRLAGIDTVVVDTKVGGATHDVRRGGTRGRVVAWLESSVVAFIFLATPCESFSVAHRPQLRSARRADGLDVPESWAKYLAKHNELARWTCEMARLADAHGVAWAVENPADRGERLSPAYWERMRDHGSLWRFSAMVELVAAVETRRATFAQCSVPDGSVVQKYTTLTYAACMEEWLGGLRACVCHHERHASVAHGRDAYGRGRAELAAAYPLGLSRWVAQAAAARMRWLARQGRLG